MKVCLVEIAMAAEAYMSYPQRTSLIEQMNHSRNIPKTELKDEVIECDVS